MPKMTTKTSGMLREGMPREEYERWWGNSPLRVQNILRQGKHEPIIWLLRMVTGKAGYLVILVSLVHMLDRDARETHNDEERERLLRLVRELALVASHEAER